MNQRRIRAKEEKKKGVCVPARIKWYGAEACQSTKINN
jgi:hypothetical protein